MEGYIEIKAALDSGEMARLRDLVDRKAHGAQSLEKFGRGTIGFRKAGNDGNIDAFDLMLKLDEIGVWDRDRPLHVATSWGFLKIAEQLLDRGEDANAVNRWDNTPLEGCISSWNDYHEKENGYDMDQLVSMVTLLLDRGGRMSAEDTQHDAGIRHALRRYPKYLPLVKLLIDRGFDVNDGDNEGCLVLEVALSSKASFEMVKLLVQHGANVAGTSALREAVKRGQNALEMVQYLVENGAGPDTYPEGTYTALHTAAVLHRLTLAGFLLDKGFSANARDADGNTPLHMAIWSEFKRSTMVELLLDRGADIDAANNKGNTPLHTALARRTGKATWGEISGSFHDEYRESNNLKPEIAKVLLDRGANIDAQNELGETALHLTAIEYRSGKDRWSLKTDKPWEMLQLLLDRGSSVAIRDREGRTALHRLFDRPIKSMALQWKIEDVIEMLLSKGADVNAREINGATALYGAAAWLDRHLVGVLLDGGADVRVRKRDQKTVLHEVLATIEIRSAADFAWDRRPRRSVKPLSARVAALKNRYMPVWDLLLDSGVEVDVQDSEGKTALHEAVHLRETTLVKTLLDRGAAIDVRDHKGRTPLLDILPSRVTKDLEYPTLAVEEDLAMIELLIDHGADVDARDESGKTVFDQLAQSELEAIVKGFQDNGGDASKREAKKVMRSRRIAAAERIVASTGNGRD
ncbi:MAG: hypothetical protein M1823_002413 [Watsoniomyces obsoletus]|nr:MAG: hypothetical protein M1823_002413 [Watsoniomyces obsoletus]